MLVFFLVQFQKYFRRSNVLNKRSAEQLSLLSGSQFQWTTCTSQNSWSKYKKKTRRTDNFILYLCFQHISTYWWVMVATNFPAGKMTLFQRWTNVENYLYDVEPTLKKGWKRKLDWRNFSDVETTLILRCQSHQPKVNVKPTLKKGRNFQSNRRTLYRRCSDVWMLTLNQRSQNDVRITLIPRCRRCQPTFNQISTSKRRRMPAGLFQNSTTDVYAM